MVEHFNQVYTVSSGFFSLPLIPAGFFRAVVGIVMAASRYPSGFRTNHRDFTVGGGVLI